MGYEPLRVRLEGVQSDVVMNPFIILLTCYRPKHSFYINLESHYTNQQCLIVEGDSVQHLNQFLNKAVLIAIFNNGRALLEV